MPVYRLREWYEGIITITVTFCFQSCVTSHGEGLPVLWYARKLSPYTTGESWARSPFAGRKAHPLTLTLAMPTPHPGPSLPRRDQPGRTSQRRPWRNEISTPNICSIGPLAQGNMGGVRPTGGLYCFPKNHIFMPHFSRYLCFTHSWTKDDLIHSNLFLQKVVQNQTGFPVSTFPTI